MIKENIKKDKANMKKYYFLLFISIPLLFLATSNNIVNIIIYSLIITSLAIFLGKLTSNLTEYIGEKKGGLLAATIGNIPELMMGIWSIKYGMLPLVKASIMGSIISNMLLGLGIAIFLGGLKYKEQKFNKIIARTNFNMLLLAMSAMIILTALNEYTNSPLSNTTLSHITLKVSIVLISIYALGLIFSLYTHRNFFVISYPESKKILYLNKKKKIITVLMLLLISVLLYFTSDKLIFNMKLIITHYNISQQFLGIILIPLLGNIGENISSIICALDNKINTSLETAIGSSIQIALFVAPILVIFSFVMKFPLILIYTPFQIIIIVIAIAMSFLVFQDGKSYWFEGAILISIYLMITLAYYYVY